MYSAIEHLARSIWLSRFKWSNRLAMYSAYFDESGHPDDSPYMVIAGCIADVKQLVHFEREWTELLAPLGTRIFHAVDFHNRVEPFDKLGATERAELLSRLVSVICRRVEKTVSEAIIVAEYEATNERYVFAECYGHPYPVLGRSCMGLVEEWAAQHSINASEILYFFEDGAKHKGQLKWVAERDGLPVPEFLDKAKAVPLQAGDLLAWCQNLHLTSNGKIPQIYDKALDQLSEVSNEWSLTRMTDPDRVPTILNIPRRDPGLQYQYRILKHRGKRHAVTHCWPKGEIEPRVVKQTLQLPDKPVLTLEAAIAAAEKYERQKHAMIRS